MPDNHHRTQLKQLGLAVVQTEADAIANLAGHIDEHFIDACELMLKCDGKVVVIGMGKSGHIGNKIAATLASTGTPAFFIHPGEASHGDLGMITKNDVALALSNSGETGEVLTILPILKRLGIPLISITGNPSSTLASLSDAPINASVAKEACPLGLAPTSSTTAALVMGDALAIALLEARGFTEADFALSHPGGSLGRRLLLHVSDIMHQGDDIPITEETAPVSAALLEMTEKKLGMTAITNQQGDLTGIFTDGDLRRMLENNIDIHGTEIKQVMTRGGATISSTQLAVEALQLMQDKKINALLVTDNNQLVGALNMHDMLKAGLS
ncbi:MULTISPECIES: KpsF/GutQ family sugar-phosphate isomerase [Cycloclasticus]|jgi:arabinose-5-phosphate isomerase|uniref:Arabinose 5-phosphate isomerase n=1 Tax=Cycloclasticus pugetii TaxID=34068 RepID=A0AB33Z2M6_9GAMM|nr:MULTISPECIES: KpsF/GutQ family sugar-phosphate isomerase [Cycloclasticus]ATI02781.1 KpsF/GutQ family sugar-phosphate isomerase [Cycloclasticus sp. PY97N]EPD13525.1 sugar isomerase [Cycloclasticus pugetii]PHR47470.1 MAG: KpsF/GutQ family sugar-phosphate isomerase [Cycloclasticus sp.]